MKTVTLGSTGITTPQNAFGALPVQRDDMETSIKILRRAFEGGMTFFDTARAYTDSEEKIGNALSDVREKIFIATKTAAKTPEDFWKDLETSLSLLKTDYVDIYQFHQASQCNRPGDGTGMYEAMLEAKDLKKTACCLLVDKEEIGSVGATGMQSRFFENVVAELLGAMGVDSNIKVRRALANSKMLSSDVSAAYDPMFESVFEKKNTAYFGHGMVFNKFTGRGGKGGSNDANPEYIAKLRKIMDDKDISFQTSELGKVDQGGGGTIAQYVADLNMDVIDCGVPVLSMHAPFEVVAKSDVYMTYRAYKAFYKR